MMKKLVSLLLAVMLVFSVAAFAEDGMTVTAASDNTKIAKYGNVELDYTCEAFLALGYQYGDVVTVSFLGQALDIPFCSNYSDVDSGSPALFARDGDINLVVAINMGDFATTYGIATKTTFEDKTFVWDYAEGVEGPVQFTIDLKEAGAYLDEYEMHRLTRTNERADYADLSDEEFANFRMITTTGMGEGKLYRSSSPVNPELARNQIADASIKAAGVTTIMNLADSTDAAQAYEGYADTYYSTTQYIALNMGVDVLDADFGAKLAEGLRFFIANPGVYMVHCTEGKDRAGFVSAILECLMGATYDEVCADYMITYTNYYGVKADEVRYETILNSNIVKTLTKAFGVEDLKTADLSACAEAYLTGIGLTAEEVAALKTNLSK